MIQAMGDRFADLEFALGGRWGQVGTDGKPVEGDLFARNAGRARPQEHRCNGVATEKKLRTDEVRYNQSTICTWGALARGLHAAYGHNRLRKIIIIITM
jgi:hypothetical protein